MPITSTTNPKPTVSAVVVTWNSSHDIAACLDSLLEQTYSLTDVIVIDNASKDETPDLIERSYPAVKLDRRDQNEGFARANNLGFARTDADWILTLNPDARIASDFIEKLLLFTEDRPMIGTLGGKLLRDHKNINEPDIIDSTGIEIFKSRRVRDRGMDEPDDGRYNEPERVFGICAAASLYRRTMFEDIVISERFFRIGFLTSALQSSTRLVLRRDSPEAGINR